MQLAGTGAFSLALNLHSHETSRGRVFFGVYFKCNLVCVEEFSCKISSYFSAWSKKNIVIWLEHFKNVSVDIAWVIVICRSVLCCRCTVEAGPAHSSSLRHGGRHLRCRCDGCSNLGCLGRLLDDDFCLHRLKGKGLLLLSFAVVEVVLLRLATEVASSLGDGRSGTFGVALRPVCFHLLESSRHG
jgi:hypothetical protein